MSYKYEDIRNFYFENELGERIDCQDINGNLFLYEVKGLGYEEEIDYVQVGNSFVENSRKMKQNQIDGELEFYNMTYDEYSNFVNFILNAKELKLIYVPKTTNRVEYYRDIDLFKIEKLEEDDYNVLPCPISMNAKTLWYEKQETTKDMSKQNREMRWNFRWDSKFTDYSNRSVLFENKGHTEAPFLLEVAGYVINPAISIFVDNEEISKLKLNITLEEYEKLLYCTKDNDLYIMKQKTDGTKENLFNDLDINNNNFFKIPKRSVGNKAKC